MVPRNLCGRDRQGQQMTRPDRPKCHHPDHPPHPGRAAAPRPAPHSGRGVARGAGRCRRPRVRSCRTTSQTTSRAIPLDRNRPARGAGRTLNDQTCRPGHHHNVRNRKTVSTTRHACDVPTPRTLMPSSAGPHTLRLTAMTTERSQAASQVSTHPQRSSPTALPWPWPAPSPASAPHRPGCSGRAPDPAACR